MTSKRRSFSPEFKQEAASQLQAIEGLFEQVLLICHQQGLSGHELFAIDSCKT
ncbi:hypothetical protein Q4551_15135 [Oceanobacter sp. 5_MG-2023]|uniref:hypothetical protein n=1 Tax=Oceanobacter sp. 5_MG-2023 TaxID=3062645 RepID=UPI0026E35F7C|nr:hypothetical protein [Oceanobacter sp. 5_MG-2023]MDO6683624.1 hypothetical protein [Oceanobacter sp. 5_MG-2023]